MVWFSKRNDRNGGSNGVRLKGFNVFLLLGSRGQLTYISTPLGGRIPWLRKRQGPPTLVWPPSRLLGRLRNFSSPPSTRSTIKAAWLFSPSTPYLTTGASRPNHPHPLSLYIYISHHPNQTYLFHRLCCCTRYIFRDAPLHLLAAR